MSENKKVELKLDSYVCPLYVFNQGNQYFIVVEEVSFDSKQEISKELYDLLVKELKL